MICDHCQQTIPDGSAFCNHCGKRIVVQKKVEREPSSPKPSGILEFEGQDWGIFINEYTSSNKKNFPSWAKRSDKGNWDFRGVVVWDKTIPRVTRLWAGQALRILDQLQNSTEWQKYGIVIGIPASVGRFHKEKGEAREKVESSWELVDEIPLTADQTKLFLDFLSQNSSTLKRVSGAEDADKAETFSHLYERVFGKEMWAAICTLAETDPDRAVDIAQKGLGRFFKEN
jgi:hypothetical protein